MRFEPLKLNQPTHRVEARLKVTGAAVYPADEPIERPAYAALVTSLISRGRIVSFDESAARKVIGLLTILTYQQLADAVQPLSPMMEGGYTLTTYRPLSGPEIKYHGQIVAVVVANTLEQAREAAAKLHVTYETQPHASTFGDTLAETIPAGAVKKSFKEQVVGDAHAAFAAAPVKIDVEYLTPRQHHNPIELYSTTCQWDGDRLTVYEPNRNITGLKHGLAQQLGIDPKKMRIICKLIGGHFGSKAVAYQYQPLIAIAARQLKRPVKFVATRQDTFVIQHYRQETKHHVQLAADNTGKLQAYVHECSEVTSRFDANTSNGNEVVAKIYSCPNVKTQTFLTRVDRNTPGPMRAPPDVPYLFALESAIDELAVALNMDPIELRRINDTTTDPITGDSYTSRPLMRCYDTAAAAFDWKRRNPRPRSMRDGQWLVGYGCATAARDAKIAAIAVRLSIDSQLRVIVETASHEIGTGGLTAAAITVSQRLGVPIQKIDVRFGDTDFPPAPISGGSVTTSSVCNAVDQACQKLLNQLAQSAAAGNGALSGREPSTLLLREGNFLVESLPSQFESLADLVARTGDGKAVSVEFDYLPHGGSEKQMKNLYNGTMAFVTPPHELAMSFGAIFVEVRIHRATGEMRVPRMTGAFAAGKIVNPLAARSQLLGGMVWGVGHGLLEETDLDPKSGKYVNNDLAEYLVATSADTGNFQAIFVEDHDHTVNPLGIKSLGELGLIGVNAAIANAVFHATGKRIRKAPVRIEDVLDVLD